MNSTCVEDIGTSQGLVVKLLETMFPIFYKFFICRQTFILYAYVFQLNLMSEMIKQINKSARQTKRVFLDEY